MRFCSMQFLMRFLKFIPIPYCRQWKGCFAHLGVDVGAVARQEGGLWWGDSRGHRSNEERAGFRRTYWKDLKPLGTGTCREHFASRNCVPPHRDMKLVRAILHIYCLHVLLRVWLQYYTGISGNVSSFNWKLDNNR